MQSFEQIITELEKPIIQKTGGATSERNELLGKFYQGLTSEKETISRKKENWKRYVSFLKENKAPDSVEMQDKFKNSKLYLKEPDFGTILWKLGYIKDIATLRDFYKDCTLSDSFSKHFFYHTRSQSL